MGLQHHAREPVFKAPWPAVLIAAVIVLGYALQSQAPDPNAPIASFALVPANLARGAWGQLITHLFLHGSWPHALFNAAGALIFATPVARLIGTTPPRAVAVFLFYLVCGVAAGGLFALADVAATNAGGFPGLRFSPATPLVGASGAISGLAGASARLLSGEGRLAPVFSRFPVGMAAAWIVANLIIGVVGFAPGAGEAQVAWQVHIIGFVVGLLLIGPWAALFGRRVVAPQPDEIPEGFGWR
jgi:membrane associated rhomboid family serine protease